MKLSNDTMDKREYKTITINGDEYAIPSVVDGRVGIITLLGKDEFGNFKFNYLGYEFKAIKLENTEETVPKDNKVLIMNTTKKKIIAATLIGAFLLSPILVLKAIFYINLIYAASSLIVWLVILLVEKFEGLKGSYQDPKNGLFSEVFKVLFILGMLIEYAFFNWLFNKNSEILLKDEVAKQITNHKDKVDRFTQK